MFTELVGGRARPGGEAKTMDISALIDSGHVSKAGVMVTHQRLLRQSTALACVRVLAEGIAQVPLKLMLEADNGSKMPQRRHPLYRLLYRRPNSYMTSFQFRETLMYWAVLAKGGHAAISRATTDPTNPRRIIELLPVPPGNIRKIQDPATGEWDRYEITDKRGLVTRLPLSEVFRVEGPSWDSVEAMDMADQLREACGLAMSIEESQAKLQANGAEPSGVITTDKTLTEPAAKRIRAMLINEATGERKGGVPILDNGAKFSQMGMSGKDAESLESRKFQVEEIARMLRVFPAVIGYSDKAATYASAEQFFIAHIVHSLSPWVVRWEQAIARDLISEEELDQGYWATFFLQGLMRGDSAARAEFYKAMLGTASSPGWGSPNDVRSSEDMNPHPDPNANRIVTVADLTGKQPAVGGSGGSPAP